MIWKRKKDEWKAAKTKKEKLIELGIDKMVENVLNEDETSKDPISPVSNVESTHRPLKVFRKKSSEKSESSKSVNNAMN